ncbi:MAG: DUF721 domain-containing protein [Planctomycetota bacterium]|nr:DUF721 domain-containing protein [Planctomycetota bacterium]MDA1177288.1 DUF721 domain-containing protein [Planctomycetota bacterium]
MEDRPNRRAPQRMGDVVSQLMARRGYARVLSHHQYDDSWREIVGEEIARQTRTGQLKRSVLEIFVQNSVLMQELTFRKSELLKRLQSQHLSHQIKEIRFKVAAVP